jgi:hypothetical protein
MPTFTVHAPPSGGETGPDRFLFVRDGFHGWAFIAPALWLLVSRLWLALAIYVVVMLALVGGLAWLGLGSTAVIAAALCVSLLIGLEAASIRRWTLARRGWGSLGFVVGEDDDEAERRFFVRWAARPAATPAEPLSPPPSLRRTSPAVIGLFPEPGGSR